MRENPWSRKYWTQSAIQSTCCVSIVGLIVVRIENEPLGADRMIMGHSSSAVLASLTVARIFRRHTLTPFGHHFGSEHVNLNRQNYMTAQTYALSVGRTHGTSAPTSRGNPVYSCRMSAASPHTRRNAMRSQPGATKAFVWASILKSSGLRQIDRTDDVLLAVSDKGYPPPRRNSAPVCRLARLRGSRP